MKESNFYVIIFKNNKKRKVLKTFITENNANEFFNKKIKESENVKFNIQYENGIKCQYKIGLVSSNWKQDQIHYTDEIGRNIIINPKLDSNLYLNKISIYNKEEKIFDVKKNKRISFDDLLKSYLNENKIYMISKLNNKFVIQFDDVYTLFSLKNEYDCDRLLDLLPKYSDKKNFIIVKDFSSPQKKYLYQILENYGYNKDFLYRNTTTHLK